FFAVPAMACDDESVWSELLVKLKIQDSVKEQMKKNGYVSASSFFWSLKEACEKSFEDILKNSGVEPGPAISATRGYKAAAQQDVASFDGLEHDLTAEILTHLRAPPEFIKLFLNVCSQSQRVFALEGALSEGWHQPTRGLPQGCPLSPLIAAAVTHAWSCFVLGPEDTSAQPITGYGYVDDRVLLLRAHGSFVELRYAVERSNRFDQAMQLEVSLPKCAIIAEASNTEAAELAAALSYKHEQDLETLGIVAPLQGLLPRSLILPCFTWAAAYVAPEAPDMAAIQHEINYMMIRFATAGAARVLLCEVVGRFLDSQYNLDVATLRAYWRSVVRPMDWTEALPLSELQGCVLKVLPMLAPTLQRLKWSCCNGFSTTIVSSTLGGLRECGPPHAVMTPHNAGNDRNLILASIGAGTSNWHFNAGGRFDAGRQRHICACGSARPSRPHLVWACPHFRGLRADVQLPENTAQERLFAMEDGVGSSGVAIQHPDTVAACGDGLEAVIAVVQASSPGSLVQWRRLFLVVDCQAAIRAIQSNNGFDYALLL
ncbi:L96, partial [Symbiodinium sp. CCMP2456]